MTCKEKTSSASFPPKVTPSLFLLTGFHLPNVNCAVTAADYEEVIQWAPFDSNNREQMSGSQNDAFPFGKTEKSYGMIACDAADALLDSRLWAQQNRISDHARLLFQNPEEKLTLQLLGGTKS